MNSHDRYAHQVLTAIEAGQDVSQRSLATTLGIALGLTNLLLRKLMRRGCVRVIRIRPNRMRYFVTPAGFAEKARMSRVLLQDSVRFYVDARNRVRDSLALLARQWPAGGADKRIIFYGGGELAEIAYICLQETDLKLVGVIDESDRGLFFGVPVFRGADVLQGAVGVALFDHVVVTSVDDRDATRERIDAMGIARERVCWL